MRKEAQKQTQSAHHIINHHILTFLIIAAHDVSIHKVLALALFSVVPAANLTLHFGSNNCRKAGVIRVPVSSRVSSASLHGDAEVRTWTARSGVAEGGRGKVSVEGIAARRYIL